MGTPRGLVNYFGGMDGMSGENMTQFDVFLNIGWDSLAGKRERFELSQVGALMISHCFDSAPKAIRLYECLPMFKNLDDQSRYLIVAKSIMKVALFAVAITLEYDKAPGGCSMENYYIIVSQFPQLEVIIHIQFYSVLFSMFSLFYETTAFETRPQVYGRNCQGL